MVSKSYTVTLIQSYTPKINVSIPILAIIITLVMARTVNNRLGSNATSKKATVYSIALEYQNLKEKWRRGLLNKTADRYKNRRTPEELVEGIVRPEPPDAYAKHTSDYKDCLMLCSDASCLKTFRDFKRKFPGNCYDTHSSDKREKYFWKFWNEIVHDFSYTFDFVLWDPLSEKETQFWYLILFLKTLVDNIDNPLDIISLPYIKKEILAVKEELDESMKEYEIAKSESVSVKSLMKEVTEDMIQFKKDKSALLLQMNTFINDAERFANYSKMLDDRIQEIDKEMLEIKTTIDHLAVTTLNTKYNKPKQAKYPGSIKDLYNHQPDVQSMVNMTAPFNIVYSKVKPDKISAFQKISNAIGHMFINN